MPNRSSPSDDLAAAKDVALGSAFIALFILGAVSFVRLSLHLVAGTDDGFAAAFFTAALQEEASARLRTTAASTL